MEGQYYNDFQGKKIDRTDEGIWSFYSLCSMFCNKTVPAASRSINLFNCIFCIHGSVHRESNFIIAQQDGTVFSLL